MKPKTIALLIGLAVLPVALFLAAFGEFQSRAERTLTIVSPHWEGIRNEFEAAFVEHWRAKTGQSVLIKWLDTGGSTNCLSYVTSAFKKHPEGIGVDVFWGGGVDPFVEMARQGLLETYKLPDEILKQIPSLAAGQPVYDPNHQWYGAALSGFGIIYNKVLLEKNKLPAPKSWTDLAAPSFNQLVQCVDPRKSGVGRMVYEIILQAYGWDQGMKIITRMLANARRVSETSSAVPKDVATGDVAAGMCIDFYAWAQLHRVGADKIGFILPPGKTVVNPDSIAILKGAPEPELARGFVRFVMSQAGQRLWMRPAGAPGGPKRETLCRMSVWPSLYADPATIPSLKPLNPFHWKTDLLYDADKGAKRGVVVNDLIGSMMIDMHSDLADAWAVVVRAGLPKPALARLTQPPVTEAEVMKMADRWRDDQVFRNQKITEWAKFAKAKYRDAKKLAASQ